MTVKHLVYGVWYAMRDGQGEDAFQTLWATRETADREAANFNEARKPGTFGPDFGFYYVATMAVYE